MRRHAKRGDRRIPIPSTSLTVLVILSAILFLTLAFAACRTTAFAAARGRNAHPQAAGP